MILALDPSSKTIGYALMPAHDRLQEAGLLNPCKRKLESLIRIEQLGQDLITLIGDAKPETIVVETTSGKVGRNRHGGGGAGLAIYGMAVGYLLRVCQEQHGAVVAVQENVWTKGVPKAERTRTIAALFKRYKPAADPGGDIADAIGLGRWYLQEESFKQKLRGSETI